MMFRRFTAHLTNHLTEEFEDIFETKTSSAMNSKTSKAWMVFAVIGLFAILQMAATEEADVRSSGQDGGSVAVISLDNSMGDGQDDASASRFKRGVVTNCRAFCFIMRKRGYSCYCP